MFTTDTRKPHCPIRIVYAPENWRPSDGALHTGSLEQAPLYVRVFGRSPFTLPLAIIRETEHGDYDGGDVQRSNHRVLSKRAEEFGLYSIIGSHGYEALAYDATLGPVPSSDELCEILDGLETYALIDDDDHSALESELEHEAWEEDGRDDFKRELTGVLDALDPGHEHDLGDGPEHDDLDKLWHDGCDLYNVNGGSGYVIETGCLVHFYIREWCDVAKRTPSTDRSRDAVLKRGMRDTLVKLAHSCRVECDGVSEYPEGSGG